MSEIWDLYDRDRNPLGVTHVRGHYLPKGTYHIAVGIWTVNSKNEVLLTLRSPQKRDWPNVWENTAGKRAERGNGNYRHRGRASLSRYRART